MKNIFFNFSIPLGLAEPQTITPCTSYRAIHIQSLRDRRNPAYTFTFAFTGRNNKILS